MDIKPLTVVECRVAIGALILLGYIKLTGKNLPLSFSAWRSFAIMAVFNNIIPFTLIVWGQTHIQSGLASILNASTPIFSVIINHYFTRDEYITPNRLIGVIIGWIGVALLIGIESLRGLGSNVYGQLAILGAALSYAIAAAYGRKFKQTQPSVVSTGMLICSSIIMIPLVFIFESPFSYIPSTTSLVALISLGIFSTSLAYIIYFHVLAKAGATNILLVTFLIPINAIILGTLILGERIAWNGFAGLALILIGLSAIDGRLFQKIKR
jgi:drug/metabolite transporter (DMT)-like permease